MNSSPDTSKTPAKIILVTGASSGIGEATAKYLAHQGHILLLGARRIDRLEAIVRQIQTSGGQAIASHLDVTDLTSVQAFAQRALDEFGRIDVWINNAGLMPISPLEALKVDEWNRMIDVNLRGVLHGIAATLPTMKSQGFGHVINVASVAAHQVRPSVSVYSATKSAVLAISEGLRMESPEIRVTVISPGATVSELAETITHPASAAFVRTLRETILETQAVAQSIAYAIAQPDDVDINEILLRPTACLT